MEEVQAEQFMVHYFSQEIYKNNNYSTNTTNTQINVDGWKAVGNILVNESKRLAFYQKEYSKTSTSDVTVTSVSSPYSPSIPVIRPAHSNNNDIKVVIHQNAIKLMGTGTGTCNINCIWKY